MLKQVQCFKNYPIKKLEEVLDVLSSHMNFIKDLNNISSIYQLLNIY